MARKASRSSIAKKAWKTRKANQRAAIVGPASPEIVIVKPAKAATISSLCTQIDDTLSALETRLTALNARINAIL